jgi:hypothetical protein
VAMGLSDVLVREIQHHYEVPLVNVPAVQLWARSYPSLLHPKAHKALVHLVHQLLRFTGYALMVASCTAPTLRASLPDPHPHNNRCFSV